MIGRWAAKLRGLLGLGMAGGVAGAILGVVWWVGASLVGAGSIAFGSLPWTIALWTGFGSFAALGVGVGLATIGSRRTLEELSPVGAAALGAAVGSLAPFLVVFAATGGFWVPSLGLIAGASGVLGGVLGSGLVVTAQRAAARELEEGEGSPLVGPGHPRWRPEEAATEQGASQQDSKSHSRDDVTGTIQP